MRPLAMAALALALALVPSTSPFWHGFCIVLGLFALVKVARNGI